MTPRPDPDHRRRPSWSPTARVVGLCAALAMVGGLGTALAAVAGPGPSAGPGGQSGMEDAAPPAAAASPAPLFRPSPLAEGEDDGGRAARQAPSGRREGRPRPERGTSRSRCACRASACARCSCRWASSADGTMEVPTDFGRAGWLTTAPVPGARGPAVIAGHVDSTTGPAVFFRLRELRAGDPVEVRQRDGDVVRFTVRSRDTFAKDEFPTGQVYGPTAGPVLRLITCDGDIDPRTGHYTDNLVVFAS